MDMEPWIYLLTGGALATIYRIRSNALRRITPETLPELSPPIFLEFKALLETAYERTLFLASTFFALAIVTISTNDTHIKTILLMGVIILVFFNVRPRNSAIKLIIAAGLAPADLRNRGITP